MGRDWKQWHESYADPESSLSHRLAVVQGLVTQAIDGMDSGEIRTISMCAGEGRDLLGVLADHPRRGDVVARLVELDPELAERARSVASELHLPEVQVVVADAGQIDAYAGSVPADLVLVCGVFGNITDADVEHTVRALPQLCAPAATVIWTRHRMAPDLTPAIRAWFDDAGFQELAFESEGSAGFGVGANRYDGPAVPFAPATTLFRFVA